MAIVMPAAVSISAVLQAHVDGLAAAVPIQAGQVPVPVRCWPSVTTAMKCILRSGPEYHRTRIYSHLFSHVRLLELALHGNRAYLMNM